MWYALLVAFPAITMYFPPPFLEADHASLEHLSFFNQGGKSHISLAGTRSLAIPSCKGGWENKYLTFSTREILRNFYISK